MSRKSEKIPWRTKCCVKGCSTRICSGVSMHGFPRKDKYPELYQHWLDAVRLANKTPLWVPLKSNRVCAFHFETVQECRIRVPTVFPNSEVQVPSASCEEGYDDFDLDDQAEDYEEDPMDVYEDSVAVNTIMAEGGSSLPCEDVENEVGYIDEDSSSTYDDIEETYNAIVGDVVSTLVTDENVMDDNTNIAYDDTEDDVDPTCNNEVEQEEDTAVSNNVEEEIVYDDGDYMFNNEDNNEESPSILTETLSAEQIGLDQTEFGDDDLCLLVIRREPDETKPESTEEVSPSKSEVQSQTIQESATKKSPVKKSPKNYPHSECAPIEESAVAPEHSVLSLSEEVRELLLRGTGGLPSDSVEPPEQEVSRKKSPVKLPSKGQFKSQRKRGKTKAKKRPHRKELRLKEEEEASPRKGKKTAKSSIQEIPTEPKQQKKSAGEGKETEMPPIEEFQGVSTSKREETEMQQKKSAGEGKETEMPPIENFQGASTSKRKETEMPPTEELQGASPSKRKETETPPSEESPEEQKASSVKDEEKRAPSKSASSRINEPSGKKIDELLLDGKPIKLKECSVHVVKTPSKLNSNKKPLSASKVEKTPEERKGTEEKKDRKEIVPSGSTDHNNFEEVAKRVPESPSEFLNALSLKTSHEDENAGLRRSARIRAGAGQRRKFKIRRSWSVAFKETPKKKFKVDMDATSQSSETVPYDFENDVDDPEVAASDLEGSDTSESEDESHAESDFSSRIGASTSELQPELNGVARKRRYSRSSYHGYHRVRLGDQATQVGLPGKCDGFIFDVVRDDPCNVGVTCNVFYHYLPKNYRHHSTWTRLKRNTDTPSTAATKNTSNPSISTTNRKTEPTKKNVPKAAESKHTARKRQSKDDKSNKKPTSKKSKDSTQNNDLVCRAASNSQLEDSEELIKVVDVTHGEENINAGATDVKGETLHPDNNYIFGIKVEPAMEVPDSFGNVDAHLVDNANGNSHPDMKLMGEFAELEVKEEKEFDDDEDTARVGKDSCTSVANLCEVSHNDVENAGGITLSNALPEPVTEPMETDDTTNAQNHAEHYVDYAESVEAMDTSDVIPHDQADSGHSSERTDTLVEYPRSTLASSLRRKSLNHDIDPLTSTKNVTAPSMPDIDMSVGSESEADSLLEDGNVVAMKGSEPGIGNRADAAEEVIGDELICIGSSSKPNEPYPTDAVLDAPGKFTVSTPPEISSSREDTEESNCANTSAGTEQAEEGSVDFQLSLKSPSHELSHVPEDAENVERFGDSQTEPGCEVECQDAADKSFSGEGENKASECPGATSGSGMSAAGDRTSGNSTKEIPEPTDSENILALPVPETECQMDAENHPVDQKEVERPPSPDFSSDDSNDSLVEVPIPNVDSDAECVRETLVGTTETLSQCSQFKTVENESNLENALDPCEVPVTSSPKTVLNCPSEKEANPVQIDSSQEVFDSIERNLEKMFELDT